MGAVLDLKLTVTCEVEGQGKTYDLEFNRDLITIGRHSLNDVQIPDKQVSAEHARILVEDDRAFLLDLGSTLGTELNGTKLGPHQKKPLSDGDEVRISEYLIRVGRPAVALDDTASEKTAMVAMRMVKEVLGSLSAEEAEEEPPRLEVTNDAEVGTRLDLAEMREYRVGRDKTGDLVLKHWSISRKHALFRRDADGVTVMDMGSKNGVLVNGERFEDSRRLRDGDVVSVGHTEVKFRNPARSALDSMDVERTPVTNLNDLPVDLSRRREEARASAPPVAETEPPPEAARSAPSPSAAPSAPPPSPSPSPAGPPPGDFVPRRRPEPESGIGDYLPMIIGGVMILGAIVAALFIFVLK